MFARRQEGRVLTEVWHDTLSPEIVRDAVGERDHVADLLASFERRHGVLYGV